MIVGVRLSGEHAGDAGTIVYTLDISASGAKLGGLHSRVAPGDIMILQRHIRHVKCKVIWVQQVAEGESQIGVQLLDEARNFWGIELPKENEEQKEAGRELWSLLTGHPAHAR